MLLRRKALAQKLGISVPTVKYYTALGLFPVSQKTPHGQFLYDAEQIFERYKKIQEMKAKRLTIKEIKERLEIEALIMD